MIWPLPTSSLSFPTALPLLTKLLTQASIVGTLRGWSGGRNLEEGIRTEPGRAVRGNQLKQGLGGGNSGWVRLSG